jgi:8-oxo-dGTP pyrophosphatase MutT (NUDIX family)
MNKFSNINRNQVKEQKQVDDTVFKGKYISIVSHNEWEFVKENDVVIILPYLRDESCILLRHEYIPTYQYFYKNINDYKNITNFLTVMSGTMEKGQSIKNTIRRELHEEAGIVLSSLYDFDIEKSLFMSKGNVARYHICILELRYNDFRLTTPTTDGSFAEKNSKTIKVSLGDIDELRTHDLITDYVLNKFRLDYLK